MDYLGHQIKHAMRERGLDALVHHWLENGLSRLLWCRGDVVALVECWYRPAPRVHEFGPTCVPAVQLASY